MPTTTLASSNFCGLKTQAISISVDPNGPPDTLTIMACGPLSDHHWINPDERLHLEISVARCLAASTPGTYQIFWESAEDDVCTPEAATGNLMDTLHLEGNLLRVGCTSFWLHPHFCHTLQGLLATPPSTLPSTHF